MTHFPILSNDAPALDAEGWALIAPFGEHPKTRLVKKNGSLREEKFIQVFDRESAAQLLSRENSLFRRIRRAVVGIPVYKGHPDLRQHSPETVTPGGAAISAIGVIDHIRQGTRGIEGHFVLSPAGAEAVEKQGCKYPSALWLVQPVGRRGGATLARPFKLLSAGLTAHPNISGVESLANAKTSPAGARAEEPKTKKEPEMKLIAGWLLAQGTSLADAENPSETEVLEAFQKLHTARAGEVASLANEKCTLAGENEDLKTELSNLQASQTALENELKLHVANFKTERKARASLVADLAIAKGKLTIAERATKIEALENAADIETAGTALLGAATKVKTTASSEPGKALANHRTGGDAREEYCAAVEKHMKETGECDPIKVHRAVLKARPALAEAFKPQP